MEQDFNPFDLSRVPPKPADEAKPTEPLAPSPTVSRISMGPLFHSRITKALAFVLGLILCVLIGYSATSYTLNKRETTESTNRVDQTSTKTDTVDTSNDTPTAQDNPQSVPAAVQDAAPAAPTQTTPTATVYCGVKGMPEGVCTAINSVEKDGLKDNKYVNADTSQVPAGSTVQVDESSWKAASDTSSTVSFTAVLSGQNYKGTATFGVLNGTWKVVSYVLQ